MSDGQVRINALGQDISYFFCVAWFAGLFYLPRIFVNLAIIFSDKNIHQITKEMNMIA